MNKDEFLMELKKIGVEPTIDQINQLDNYYRLLIEWNQNINLTRITEKKQVYLKHFYDSATIFKIVDLEKEKTLCDIGTGAGFPGIVLKILFPKLNVTLVDTLNKRILFLNEVISKLGLENIQTIHSRVEDFARNHRDEYDVVTARAVAPLNILLEYCIPLIKCNKYFIAMKSDISREINNSQKAMKNLNCYQKQKVEFNLPIEDSVRTLIVFSKDAKTNQKYPRTISQMKISPL